MDPAFALYDHCMKVNPKHLQTIYCRLNQPMISRGGYCHDNLQMSKGVFSITVYLFERTNQPTNQQTTQVIPKSPSVYRPVGDNFNSPPTCQTTMNALSLSRFFLIKLFAQEAVAYKTILLRIYTCRLSSAWIPS